jgi:hypothetical protein
MPFLGQLGASATFIAAEAATAALLEKQPQVLPTLKLLVADWAKFQLGQLTQTDEATLLQSIASATALKLDPIEAALLDGATQQVLSNTNASAPTPLSGAAAAIITDLMNGIARELAITTVTVPATS